MSQNQNQNNKSQSHECMNYMEWLMRVHYMCSCGHVEWSHHGKRDNKGQCMHCNCKHYDGEIRPLTYQELKLAES